MFARINHLAICTTNYAINARFYQALFGMKAANTQRPARVMRRDPHGMAR
jgi:catechol 2,3-dioxygenase-like lactoylglutathione lyase family enzyme